MALTITTRNPRISNGLVSYDLPDSGVSLKFAEQDRSELIQLPYVDGLRITRRGTGTISFTYETQLEPHIFTTVDSIWNVVNSCRAIVRSGSGTDTFRFYFHYDKSSPNTNNLYLDNCIGDVFIDDRSSAEGFPVCTLPSTLQIKVQCLSPVYKRNELSEDDIMRVNGIMILRAPTQMNNTPSFVVKDKDGVIKVIIDDSGNIIFDGTISDSPEDLIPYSAALTALGITL